MGIYDREYYRDETRGSGWLSGVAPVCKWIILANIVALLLQKFNPAFDAAFWADSTKIFQRGEVWRLLTAAFLHNPNSIFHILFNMMFLWIAGRDMESMYGSRNFLVFYLCAAVFSSLCWAIPDYLLNDMGRARGASGAVMAVVMLYTLYYPNREIILYIFPMKMWTMLVIFLGFDLVQFLSGAETTTAVAAHLGGALFGYLFKVGDLRFSRLLSLINVRRRPKLRVISPEPRETYKPRPSPPPPPPVSKSAGSAPTATATAPPSRPVMSEEQLDAQLDEVLAKIARQGNRDGLTDEEKAVLEQASLRARRRRERI